MSIENELTAAGGGLSEIPRIIVATKLDLAGGSPGSNEVLVRLKQHCRDRQMKFLAISAVTGDGIQELIGAISEILREFKPLKALRGSRHNENRARNSEGEI